jgi:voltage-gated potassium channel
MADEIAKTTTSLRRTVYEILEPSARNKQGFSWANKLLICAILVATFVAVVATEESIATGYGDAIKWTELALGCLFLVEYAARFWIAPETRPKELAAIARAKFLVSPSAVLDLIVIVATFSPFFVANLTLLRLLRLLRIFRLAKLGRMSRAMENLIKAVHSRRHELGLTMGFALALLLLGSSTLYWIEGDLQPEKFGSIPRSLWWAVITMTTIGYGDVYPITPLGKVVAALVAIAGVGLIAMPTGILAAAFSDAMRKDDEGDS